MRVLQEDKGLVFEPTSVGLGAAQAETPALVEELAFLILHLPPQIHLFANRGFSRTSDRLVWQIRLLAVPRHLPLAQRKQPAPSIIEVRTKEQHAGGCGSKFSPFSPSFPHGPEQRVERGSFLFALDSPSTSPKALVHYWFFKRERYLSFVVMAQCHKPSAPCRGWHC